MPAGPLLALTGKVAVVTGASKGIGKATALALGAAGANVVVNYLSSANAAKEVVQAIGADRAIAIKADVSDLSQGKELVQKTVEHWGRIDILVLNAGVLTEKGALADTTEEDFDRLFKVNVKGPFFLIKEAVPHIPEGGRVMLFSTSLTAASIITPNYLLYVSTKGAIEQMTRVLAKDLGRRKITVNTISPGPIATDAFYEGKTEQIVKALEGFHPQGRVGQPEEVAKAIVLVASDDSSWMNGVNFRVNGGMTVG